MNRNREFGKESKTANRNYKDTQKEPAFIIDCRMSLYEHQASINPNLPLRDLFYVAKEYQGMVTKQSLYSSKLVKLPTPCFVVFYNGLIEQPEYKEMKLSDSFMTPVKASYQIFSKRTERRRLQ